MKKIKFGNTTHKSADGILKAIENRAKRQSRIYLVLFLLLAVAVTGFMMERLSTREYDGYVSHKDVTMRAVSNIAIVDYYVKPGDVVSEGDTLYSYLMIDWLEDRVNPLTADAASARRTESDLRIAKFESEVIEVNNTIDSLRSAIEGIREEVRSGVKTEDGLVGLKLQLAERVERSKHLCRAVEAELEMQSKFDFAINNHASLTAQGVTERRENLANYGEALRYRVAYVDSKIINIKAPYGMITLKSEDVLQFQPIGHHDMTDGHIKMIVSASDFEELYEGMEVDVYAGEQFLGVANVSFLGARMAEAYARIEEILDRTTELDGKLLVRLNLQQGYEMPEKYVIDNFPVEIRYRVWNNWFTKRHEATRREIIKRHNSRDDK